MSYDIYLYDPQVKVKVASGLELDEVEIPRISDEIRQQFVNRLIKYDYEAEKSDSNVECFIHKNRSWSIQVAVFSTEIAFSVPYWDDAENAIFEALMTAHEISDSGNLVVYDPQTEEWSS